MSEAPRKKSPRAPSMPLDEAIERAISIYDKERRHAAPTDVIAQNLGYKSANNGAALSVIASLRYYGLLEKAQEGKLAVSKDVESFRFAPDDSLKEALQLKWLKSPQIFAELLDNYGEGLPSDATLRFTLIQRGFAPGAAESLLGVFKKSVEFTGYFDRKLKSADAQTDPGPAPAPQEVRDQRIQLPNVDESDVSASRSAEPTGYDRIPVRLPGGRRAWLEIPSPFYSSDKNRLKSQIDLLLADDDDVSLSSEE